MVPLYKQPPVEERVTSALILLAQTSRLVCAADVNQLIQGRIEEVNSTLQALRSRGLLFSASSDLYWITQDLLDQAVAA